MAHIAKLNDKWEVEAVVAIGDEYEENCEQLYHELTGDNWKRTSYNTRANVHHNGGVPFRYNYAIVGGVFNPNIGTDGAFIDPQPYPSWNLNTTNMAWEAPYPEPEPGKYYWFEMVKRWVPITEE